MSKVDDFIDYLSKLVEQEDRAALARLRHSLAFVPGEYVHAFPFVERFTVGLVNERRKLYFLVAGLFATHPATTEALGENFGRTLKRLYTEQDQAPSIEKRFLALLEADDDQIAQHLRHLVNLIKSKGFAVNWSLLLQDLISRQHDPDPTNRKWAQGFYRPLDNSSSQDPTQPQGVEVD